MSVPLSVLVLTKNEARNIGACLESVAGWAADILVLDSGSEDRTLAICAEHGVRTVYHAYADHRSQITWGMTEVPWQHEWLLLLDADNVVTPEFKREMRRRSAVEPVIGHLKAEHRMGRNYLCFRRGDATNAVLAAAGYNFRRLIHWLRLLWCQFLTALLAEPLINPS